AGEAGPETRSRQGESGERAGTKVQWRTLLAGGSLNTNGQAAGGGVVPGIRGRTDELDPPDEHRALPVRRHHRGEPHVQAAEAAHGWRYGLRPAHRRAEQRRDRPGAVWLQAAPVRSAHLTYPRRWRWRPWPTA